MSDARGPVERVRDRVEAERTAYDHRHEQPMAGYGAVLATFAAAAGVAIGVGKATGRRLPADFAVRDLVIGGVAVHKAGRLIALDAVTSPLRAPFTRFQGPTGSSEVAEDVRRAGVGHAVGEMVSCPFCLAPWLSATYVAGLALAPRVTRAVAAGLAIVGSSDWIQQAYDKIKS